MQPFLILRPDIAGMLMSRFKQIYGACHVCGLKHDDTRMLMLCAETVLACPGSHKGHVRVELFELRRTNKIEAHNSHLGCIALNLDGSRYVPLQVVRRLRLHTHTHTHPLSLYYHTYVYIYIYIYIYYSHAMCHTFLIMINFVMVTRSQAGHCVRKRHNHQNI